MAGNTKVSEVYSMFFVKKLKEMENYFDRSKQGFAAEEELNKQINKVMETENKKLEDEIKGKVVQSNQIKKLMDYLVKESNGEHTEFRVVIGNDGTGYAHVMNRDCDSLNFELPSFFKRK